jgi:hypothetical protein
MNRRLIIHWTSRLLFGAICLVVAGLNGLHAIWPLIACYVAGLFAAWSDPQTRTTINADTI